MAAKLRAPTAISSSNVRGFPVLRRWSSATYKAPANLHRFRPQEATAVTVPSSSFPCSSYQQQSCNSGSLLWFRRCKCSAAIVEAEQRRRRWQAERAVLLAPGNDGIRCSFRMQGSGSRWRCWRLREGVVRPLLSIVEQSNYGPFSPAWLRSQQWWRVAMATGSPPTRPFIIAASMIFGSHSPSPTVFLAPTVVRRAAATVEDSGGFPSARR
nr:hypothetical protein Iba_chr05dCG10150 [Ipomoea batatas]